VYETCPKCGYRRTGADTAPVSECPACGLLFAKWMKQRFRVERPPVSRADGARARNAWWPWLRERLLFVEPRVNPFYFWGRCAVLAGLLVWSGWFWGTDHRTLFGHLPEINASFMHNVNLAFHEAGHVIFAALGDFMAVLGGSLMQLLVPFAVGAAFVLRHANPFGGAVALWWLGQSAMDLAPYVHDARAQQLLLVGGVLGHERPGYHDWNNLLGRLGLLELDHVLAGIVNAAGIGLMALACAWGAYLLYFQYRRLDRRF